MIREFIDYVLEKFGYITVEESTLRSLTDRAKQKRARQLSKRLNELKSYTDINQAYSDSAELTSIFKEAVSTKGGIRTFSRRTKDAISLVSMSDLYGYKPGMSRLYGLFSQNVFGLYAFIARHHPAIRACIQVIMDEIDHDGMVLVAEKGTSKKRLKDVYKRLNDAGIPEMRRMSL